MINIVDYGVGNIQSISNSLDYLNIPYKLTNRIEDWNSSKMILLPGVGNFEFAISEIINRSLFEQIIKISHIKSIKLLGICLGMQLLLESSQESRLKGLGLIKGDVKKFDESLISPRVGISSVDGKNFYFMHSYYCDVKDNSRIYRTKYNNFDYCAALNNENIYGCQFHPEKSGKEGLELINNLYHYDQFI
jgi:glutamine amidotransferase